MDSAYYRGGFLEKIEKTIAMITASPEYLRYIKKVRQQAWNDSMTDFEGGTRAKRFKGLNIKEPRHCATCDCPLTKRSAFKMCFRCGHEMIVDLYRSGLSIDALVAKFKVSELSILNYLRDKSRPKKIAPVVSERIPVMV